MKLEREAEKWQLAVAVAIRELERQAKRPLPHPISVCIYRAAVDLSSRCLKRALLETFRPSVSGSWAFRFFPARGGQLFLSAGNKVP